MEELLKALQPIIRGIETNDGDTLSRLRPDSEIIWTATASWSPSAPITLGDLREIADAARSLK